MGGLPAGGEVPPLLPLSLRFKLPLISDGEAPEEPKKNKNESKVMNQNGPLCNLLCPRRAPT